MTNEDIERLAGHRNVPSWVMKLVGDAIKIENESCAKVCEELPPLGPYKDLQIATLEDAASAIRARKQA